MNIIEFKKGSKSCREEPMVTKSDTGRAVLPSDITYVGFLAFSDAETSLWRPFGSRRVVDIVSTTSVESLRRKKVYYLVASPPAASVILGQPWTQWLSEAHAEIITNIVLKTHARAEPTVYSVARITDYPMP